MVMASAKMARRIAATVPEIAVPETLIQALDSHRDAGLERAIELIDAIRESGAFDGVHLVPVGRYGELAHRLLPKA